MLLTSCTNLIVELLSFIDFSKSSTEKLLFCVMATSIPYFSSLSTAVFFRVWLQQIGDDITQNSATDIKIIHHKNLRNFQSGWGTRAWWIIDFFVSHHDYWLFTRYYNHFNNLVSYVCTTDKVLIQWCCLEFSQTDKYISYPSRFIWVTKRKMWNLPHSFNWCLLCWFICIVFFQNILHESPLIIDKLCIPQESLLQTIKYVSLCRWFVYTPSQYCPKSKWSIICYRSTSTNSSVFEQFFSINNPTSLFDFLGKQSLITLKCSHYFTW